MMKEPKHLCSICEQEMYLLPEKTSLTHEPVYVCATPRGKAKFGCDGSAYENATRQS